MHNSRHNRGTRTRQVQSVSSPRRAPRQPPAFIFPPCSLSPASVTHVSSKRKCKAEGYRAVCVQHVAVSCCLSAKQMTTSKQCKEPTNELQRLDHATTLEASLSRQIRCDCSRDQGEPALGTAPALLQDSLPRLIRSNCRRDF
jgi:hypothetical protein